MPGRTNPLFAWLMCAAFLATGNLFSQSLTINTSLCGCQPGAGSPCPGNTNYLMCTFAFNITSGCPSFTAINAFTTSGTYTATDIVNFKLYETNFSVFNTSTLVATITTGLGPGAHTFSGFNRTTCAATQRYYWITCDFPAGAVAGRTIRINLITAAMYAVTGTVSYGTNTAAGNQTICNTLPVSLISFTGENLSGHNVLEWQCASETNNDYFTVEKSSDGISFETFARIDGVGTTTELTSYSTTDETSVSNAITYYRLRQTDFDGQYEYVGGTIAVQSSSPEEPVAIDVGLYSLFLHQQCGDLNYAILDLSGRPCREGLAQGGTSEISLSGLPRGTYILRLNDPSGTSLRFVKVSD